MRNDAHDFYVQGVFKYHYQLCTAHISTRENIREALPKKKVTKLRTFSVPPLAPPPPRIYGHLWGSFF